ncbi:lipid-binding SYLF domain-containing protein [Stakelama marina]|uniref:Lipid-binding SYLF domain-containing protein n=1 Tax=Stakelama marina TaxID=2826939 RepID=A0A8T4IDA0_9SPHN|nr:lipid-binding SYLF domain-containing protein [Stakelama marina]MBR0552627.1 lipid-binding SYLF domain-containing protein [Stakelama marina]
MKYRPIIMAAAVASLAACNNNTTTTADTNMAADNGMAMTTGDNMAQTAPDAQQLVDEATAEVQKMKADPDLAKLIKKAKGIYIVPEFGRGAFIVGGRGGAGVVLANQTAGWTAPAFYDFGALSVGAQAGGSGGQLAFLLMTDNAVDAFMSGNKISLNAESGLSIVNYSANAQASWGKGDIIMWSDTEGAYAGATVSVTDINWDDDNNQNYYGEKVDPNQILSGKITKPAASQLQTALAG